MQQQRRAYLLALMAVLFWSTIGSAFKVTLRHVDFINLVLYSTLVSVFVLTFLISIRRKWKFIFKSSGRSILRSAGIGLLNPFLFYVILIKAYDILLAQEAVVLNYVWPITLVLLSVPILKQRISAKSIFAICLSFAGVIFITLKGDFTVLHFTNYPGVALALFSTVIWALFWIFNVKDSRDAVIKLFLNFIFGFIYILIFTLSFYKIQIPDIRGITGLIYIGIFEMGITYVIWLKALKLSTTTAKVSNLIFLSPFLSLIFVSIFVGEQIMFYTIVGLLLIIGGIVIQRFIR